MKLSASDYANTIIDGLMGYKPFVDGEMNPFMADSDRHFYGRLKTSGMVTILLAWRLLLTEWNF